MTPEQARAYMFEGVCEVIQGIGSWENKGSTMTLTAETTIAELGQKLGADSLNFLEFVVALERNFGIVEITPEESTRWVTLADVVEHVYQAALLPPALGQFGITG